MCPTCEPEQTNGHANGTNGTANGGHEGFTGVQTRNNPRPDHTSPYKPVGDFLSNVSRFKIIGTSSAALDGTVGACAQSDSHRQCRHEQRPKNCANGLLQRAHSVKASSSPMPTSISRPRSRLLRRLMSLVLTVCFIPAAQCHARFWSTNRPQTLN